MQIHTSFNVCMLALSLLFLLVAGIHPRLVNKDQRWHRGQRFPTWKRAQLVGSDQITQTRLHQLESYFDTFDLWVNDLISQQPEGSVFAAQLQQRHQAFKGWVEEWLRAIGQGRSLPYFVFQHRLTLMRKEFHFQRVIQIHN